MRKWVWVMFPFWLMTACFDYGHPAGGKPEPDVLFQVTMEPNGSNQLVDTVNGIVLSENGSPEYDKRVSGAHHKLTPGIYYPDGAWHEGTLTDELNLAADQPCTTELWVQGTDFYTGIHGLFSAGATALGQGINVFTIGDDLAEVSAIWWAVVVSGGIFGTGAQVFLPRTTFDLADGKLHHLRLVFDPSGTDTSYIEIDDTVYGTYDMTRLAGNPMNFVKKVRVGAVEDTDPAGWGRATIYEVRVSGNATNNSTPVWYP